MGSQTHVRRGKETGTDKSEAARISSSLRSLPSLLWANWAVKIVPCDQANQFSRHSIAVADSPGTLTLCPETGNLTIRTRSGVFQ